ncbi:MAG TPA: hypothetical protein VHM92_05335 [Allosphingosinicella sp.]|nr:hypothetical protein [Allosphingosinicella sp.]
MGDFDRDRETIRETPPETVRETDRTTVVTTDGGRGGGGGVIAVVVLLLVVLAILWFVFGGGLNKTADKVGVNVNVDAPNVSIPDKIDVKLPDNVKVPDVNVKTDGDGNASK